MDNQDYIQDWKEKIESLSEVLSTEEVAHCLRQIDTGFLPLTLPSGHRAQDLLYHPLGILWATKEYHSDIVFERLFLPKALGDKRNREVARALFRQRREEHLMRLFSKANKHHCKSPDDLPEYVIRGDGGDGGMTSEEFIESVMENTCKESRPSHVYGATRGPMFDREDIEEIITEAHGLHHTEMDGELELRGIDELQEAYSDFLKKNDTYWVGKSDYRDVYILDKDFWNAVEAEW